eukprot:4325930-Pyramimonas_sp.AAC.2
MSGIKSTHEFKLKQERAVGPLKRSNLPAIATPEEIHASIPYLMQIMQGHYISMSMNALVRLGVPDAIGAERLTVRTPPIALAC